jgi:hypothetical protein
MLTHRSPYQDLGANYFDRIQENQLTKALVRRLEKLGHTVVLKSIA